MKKRFLLLLPLLLALGLALSLTACGHTYTEQYARISEPYGSSFLVNGNLQKTTVEGRTYLFDPAIPPRGRKKFIKTQEALCRYLTAQDIDTHGMTFYVLPDYPCRADSAESTVWFGLDAAGTEAQITATLLGAMGDYTNYGYVTALSYHIAEALTWETAAPATEIETALFAETPALLNLVYPCFAEPYATAEQAAACRTLAILLSERLDNSFAGEAAYLRAIEDFAAEAHIAFTPTHLVFAYNGASCPLKLRTDYMEIFCDATYRGSFDDLGAEYEPMRSVTSILDFFEELDAQIAPVQALFGVGDVEPITVQMLGNIPSLSQSGFDISGLFYWEQGQPKIMVTTLYSLLHEYVHRLQYERLTADTGTADFSSWTLEVLTCYFSAHYSYLGRSYRIAAGLADDVSDVIGRPYDDASDELFFLRRMLGGMQLRGDTNKLPYYLKTAYNVGAPTFGDFFVQAYGAEALVDCMLYPERIEEVTKKSLDTLIDDWCDWIMQVAPEINP